MIDGKRVVAFTPAGRKRYMEVLVRYVQGFVQSGLVDEWILFENTYNQQDKAYVDELRSLPWVRVLEHSDPFPNCILCIDRIKCPNRCPHRIATFYKYIPVDPSAVYLRLDDDLCYFEPGAIEKLLAFRCRYTEPFLVYPNIFGNTRMAYYQQQLAGVPRFGCEAVNEILNATWKHKTYIVQLHRWVLQQLYDGTLSTLPSFTLDTFEHGHISVNCFSMLGEDMAQVGTLIGVDEETWLSKDRPEMLGRKNAVAGDANVVHFAYFTQTQVMEESGLFEQYKELSLRKTY